MTICTQGIYNFDTPTIGVEVIFNGDKVDYKYCCIERWNHPDCVPGCVHRFWYIEQMTLTDNSVVVQEYITVLYYADKYVILNCPNNIDQNCPRFVEILDEQYSKINMSTIAFNQDLDVFEQYSRITAVGSAYLTEDISNGCK